MKLNYDCVRSVLLTLENEIDMDDDLRLIRVPVTKLFEKLSKYESKDILYTVEKLSEAGYINAAIQYTGSMFADGVVSGITYSGHEFLESVRDSKVWANVKSTLSKVGAITLPLIAQTAEGIIMKSLGSIAGI